jgi:hypothetical protein
MTYRRRKKLFMADTSELSLTMLQSTVVQTTYRPTLAPAVPGMIADEVAANGSTRQCETSAGIGFGLAVGQGTGDKGCVLGGANFIGISVRDITLNQISPDPLYSGSQIAADTYPQRSNVSVLSSGHIWVTAGDNVAAGNSLSYDATTGAFSTGTAGCAATGSITFTSQPTAGQTVTINGTAVTFEASGASGEQVNIGPTLGDTVVALAAFLNANVASDANIAEGKFLAYPPSPGGSGQGSGANTLMVAAAAVGAGAAGPPTTGNHFTLATNVTGATVSGATLTGGNGDTTVAVAGGYWLDTVIAGQVGRVSLGIQR